MRKVLFFIFFCSVMLTLPSIVKRFTRGFRVAKMQLDFPIQPEWDTTPKNITNILQQKYHFLGKGAQCYVFESKDGQYVVKLFRYDRFPQKRKVMLLFNAAKMAYDELMNETGLIYIHLNPTIDTLPVLHCKDAVGRSYHFSLDHFRFCIQKKAFSFEEALLTNPKERIDQFLDLLKIRVSKKIHNSDPNVFRNFGFLEDRAIEFDFGNFRREVGLDEGKEIRRYTVRLRKWLQKNAPEWVEYLDNRIYTNECKSWNFGKVSAQYLKQQSGAEGAQLE